jgi:MerR family Zn(II)-responsive transcriptional regulator of zntA
MHDGMRIGELAARFDLNPKTIRYYEEIGLLPQADRSASGYRRYDERDVERLGFIRRAKALGLSLDEIRAILVARTEGELPCSQVLSLIEKKIAEIDQRIQALQTFRTELATLRANWVDEHRNPRHVPAPICPIIERQAEVGEHTDVVQTFAPSAQH